METSDGDVALCGVRDISGRLNMEDALRASEQNYRELFEGANDIVYTHDFEGNFTAVNPAGLRRFGYTAEEIGRVNIAEIIDPQHVGRAREEVIRKLRGAERSEPYELLTHARDGADVWVEVSTRVIMEDGRAIGVQGIARDITDWKRAEEVAREHEARLRVVTSNVPVAMFAFDANGIITFLEGKGLDGFGLAPGSLVGQSVINVYGGYPPFRSAITRALAGEAFTVAIPMKAGAIESTFTPVFNEHGALVSVVGMTIDITDRLRVEEERRTANEFRELVMASTTDGIAAFDINGRFTLVNRRVEEISGYTAAELIGQPFDMLHSATEQQPMGSFAAMLARKKTVSGLESEITRKDGEKRIIRANFGPIVKDGVVAGAAGTAEDVTEQRRAEKLLASQKRLLELIATGKPLDEVLGAVVLTVAELADGAKCLLLQLDDDGQTLRRAAAAGLPDAVLDAMDGMRIGPTAGAQGAAAYLGAEVITAVIGTDPRWAEHRALMAAHSIQSAWALPVFSGERAVLGTLAIYGERPGQPDDRLRPLLEVAAHIAGVAIERGRTERALRQSEERYRQIFERNSAIKLIVDPADGVIVDANPAASEFYGYSLDQLTSMTVFDLNTAPREQVLAELARAIAEERSYFQFHHRLSSGEIRDIEIYAGPIDAGGRKLICSIIHDITERKRSEALLESHRHLLEMIAAGAPLTGVLDTLMETFEAHAPEATGSVLLLSADGEHLHHASGPSLPAEYSKAIDGLAIGPNVGSCGTAAYRREQVVVTDIASNPLWADYRDLALSYGLRSCWSTPIFSTGGDVLGTFAVYYREQRAPSGGDRLLIEIATHVAGVAIERQRGEQALRTRNEELERLYGQLVRAHTDLAESKAHLEEKSVLLERALELERERARRDPLTGTLNHAAITDELRELIASPEMGPVAIAMVDVDGLKVANDTYGHQIGDDVLVKVAAALRRDGAIVGRYGGDEFVAILARADRAAAEQYRDHVLASLADAGLADPLTGARVPIVASMGLAIHPHEAEAVDDLIRLSDSAMYASRRQRSVQSAGGVLGRSLGGDYASKMVGEIVPLLTSQGDLKHKLGLVAHRLSVGAGYDAVNFVLQGPQRLESSAFAPLPEDAVEAWNRQARRGGHSPLTRMLARTKRPIILDDLEHDERLAERERTMCAFAGIKSGLIAPMLWEGRMIGALSVGSKRTGAFSVRDADFVAAVATQVAAIVRMASFVEELQSSSARLMQAHTETVLMLAGAAEAHDQTTGRHLQRVSSLAEALARELGYDETHSKELALAAVLHDIGKIRVPDMVLGSSSKLAESEWVLMKQHTLWGSEFLAGQQGFELAAAVARNHHERWDGTGYPSGLAGDEIPEAAQITAVADAFDAMTNDRPYRLGRPAEEAIGEIVACSGTQFSPRVVDALVRLWEHNELRALDGGETGNVETLAA